MAYCGWCGKEGEIGWAEYYSIDSPYPNKHELLHWCSVECFYKAEARTRKFKEGKLHSHNDEDICLGEFYTRQFPLSKLKKD